MDVRGIANDTVEYAIILRDIGITGKIELPGHRGRIAERQTRSGITRWRWSANSDVATDRAGVDLELVIAVAFVEHSVVDRITKREATGCSKRNSVAVGRSGKRLRLPCEQHQT